MKIQTSQLAGAALDWAVIQAECGAANTLAFIGGNRSKISESWATCGPIIEREHIGVYRSSGQWIAEWWPDNSGMARNPAQKFQHNRHTCGPTPLVAAMRAYVQSRLGNEVDVPEELTGD